MAENLEATLRQQLTAAMKAKDTRTANLVRMINTKIMERRTAKDFSGTVDDALIRSIADGYAERIEPLDDMRGSAWYRREMVRVWVRRAIEGAVAQARGGGAA